MTNTELLCSRDPEGNLEKLDLQAQLVLKVPEEKGVSWASRDLRETEERWVNLDLL